MNNINSSSRSLTINASHVIISTEETGSPGGGGGGGGGNQGVTYVISESELSASVIRSISAKDKINFTILNQTHSIKMNKLGINSSELILASNPITFSLSIGENKKFDLNEDNFYDLKIILNSIQNSKINLMLQKINEEVPSKKLFNAESNINQTEDNLPEEASNQHSKNSIELGLIILISIIIIGLILIVINFIQHFKLKSSKNK
jgi:hypothetical protein